MTDEQFNAVFHGLDLLDYQKDALRWRINGLLSASIADTAKPVIDKSMVKRLMVQHGLDKSHESIADTAGANCATCGAVGTVTSTKARCILCGMFADTAGAIRNQSLEEAAKICDKWADHYGDEESTGQQFACDRCADSIRDLFAAPPAPSVADAAGASDAERYRWIATLQDWRDIERMCWSSPAKSAAQFKADLDKYIDAAIAKEQKP